MFLLGDLRAGLPLLWPRLAEIVQQWENPTWVFLLFAFYLTLQFEGSDGHRSQDLSANVDFGDERAVDGAFLGNLKEL